MKPTLELTPEQEEIVVGSCEPVAVHISESQGEYVIIAKHILDEMRRTLARERLDFTFKEFSDFVAEP
jgi:hypothetical protein